MAASGLYALEQPQRASLPPLLSRKLLVLGAFAVLAVPALAAGSHGLRAQPLSGGRRRPSEFGKLQLEGG